MKRKSRKTKKILFLLIILLSLILNSFSLISNFNLYPQVNENKSEEDVNSKEDILENHALSNDNIYSGIGAPWNVTHWANRTDIGLTSRFSEGLYDIVGIPLESGWEGYNLDAKIENLYDTRNWCNGTFSFGNDNGYQTPPANDSSTIPVISNNGYQNWTFHSFDNNSMGDAVTNQMSGNYINSGGRDYFELRMNAGSRVIPPITGTWDAYDPGDICMWNSSFYVDRGDALNCTLEFDVNPYYLADINTFALTVYINDQKVYSRGTYRLEQDAGGENNWIHVIFPQLKWKNQTNVFSGNLNNSEVEISVALESTGSNMRVPHAENQILYIDNVELNIRSEVKPFQIGLQLNSTEVLTSDWGEGSLKFNAEGNEWRSFNQEAHINFSCIDTWDLNSFSIDLNLDASFFALKSAFDTTYEAKTTSVGTKFTAENDSNINWEWFEYIQVPHGYQQNNISIQFPKDINITGVYDPQSPSDNIINKCDKSTRGLLIINISDISLTPDGFWKFEGISPNYCQDIDIYVDKSGSWIKNNTIISGDKINIRANISISNPDVDISNYIEYTSAQLKIRLPNGTIWSDLKQIVNVDQNGLANFSFFKIPDTISSLYIAGEYQAIITWNNSYSSYSINETGIISKSFIIQHDSIFEPEDNNYFIENIVNGSAVNIKVSFRDKIDNKYISGAYVYAKDPSESTLVFSETSPGFYLYILDTLTIPTGNITLRVHANSSYYLNKQINITIDIIEETILTVNNDFLTNVQYNQNFSIQFNYTRNSNPLNEILIDINNDFYTDWTSDYYIVRNVDGTYNLTCNTTGYIPNIIHTFIITLNSYKFESQTREINVLISELDSKMEIFVNNTPLSINDIYNVEVWQSINITARYMDINNKIISNGNVKVTGRDGLDKNLTYIPQNDYYNIILNVSELAEGIDYLDILGESINHKPSSIPFIVQISENKTEIEIYLNGVNKTADPSIELSYGSLINITVKYTSGFIGSLDDASMNLTGDYIDNLLYNISLGQYSIILDTRDLAVGVKIIRLTAAKINFETQVEDLRVAVRKIRTEVTVEDAKDDKIEIKPGESLTLTVEVFDLDNNMRIRGAKVEYEWKLKDGEFDEESNGLYEEKLEEIPEGTYTITITVSKEGDEYDFESVEITLVVRSAEEESSLWQILLVIAIIIIGGLVGYFIYYQKVLKYPKPVRKVRKYRRTLRKNTAPRIDIISRKKAFDQLFNDQKKLTSSLLKSKGLESDFKPDKIDKTIKSATSEMQVKKVIKKGSSKKATKEVVKKLASKKGDKGKDIQPNKTEGANTKKLFQNSNENLFEKRQKKTKVNKKLHLKIRRRYFNSFKVKFNKRIFFLSVVLIFLVLNLYVISSNKKPPEYNNDNDNYFFKNDLKSQDLVFYDNTINSTGIGAPWNITYYANRTDTSSASFSNNSYDLLQVQSASGWTGVNLTANIKDLHDARQWVNGTMHYGGGDGTEGVGEDDDNDIQDWLFDGSVGPGLSYTGNYINDTSSVSNGHDCLELRLDGSYYYDAGLGGDRYLWTTNSRCYWEYTVDIPRGEVIDSSFAFDISPVYIAHYTNAWAVTVYINNNEILYFDILDLLSIGEGNWGHYEFSQEAWTSSDVFPAQLDGTSTEVEIRLAYYGGNFGYGIEDGPHIDYQQVLFDNVELKINAEAQPTQVNLELNNTAVQNGNYGEGSVEITGYSWNGTENPFVKANFSSIGSGDYGGYDIDLEADLNLHVKKDTPDTYFEQDTSSPGTFFTVNNNSQVNWKAYGYINTPTNYEVSIMKIEYPSDYNLYWVSSPIQPEVDVSSSCVYLSDGINIPISQISDPSKPDGFWELKASSPNYFEELKIFRNGTNNPLDNVWDLANTFYSGDYVNITAKLFPLALILDHISLTKAQLQIRFPNGTLWDGVARMGNIDNNGNIIFDYFRIPINPPVYEAGQYDAIITWNNSFTSRGFNETGVIYKKFQVIHESILAPIDGNYYIENIVDIGKINVKVEFKDKMDNTAIENAHVYTKNSTNHVINFSQTNPGVYLYEFDTQEARTGNNTITIYGNSTFYLNQEINITIDVTKQTILTVDNDYFSVPSISNFSVLFNYTEYNSPDTGINTSDISTNWIDEFTITRLSQGQYNLTCNTSAYPSNQIHTLILTVKAYRYVSHSIPIRIFVSELSSSITLKVNNTDFATNDIYNTEVWQKINITIEYKDSFGGHLSGANVSLLGKGDFQEQGIYEQYSIIINASTLSEDVDTLTIFANKSQYNPQTTQFLVIITERQTNMEIWLNNVNSTKDPTIILPIGQHLNVEINYTDTLDAHVENATVKLLGEGYNLLLSENKVRELYLTTINTDQLGLGTKILTIDSSKNNYEPALENMRVIVRKIRTEVTTEDGEKSYEINPGEDFTLTIELKDLDFGGKIEGADVTYDWKFGNGDLEEVDDGIYEITFENVPEGSYSIKISVFKEGGKYEFDDLKITLTAARPEGESLLFLILLLIAITVAVALASYIIYYQKVLKYPKPVRKVRKYRKTLKKKTVPGVDIISRKKAFNEIFGNELKNLGDLIKGKTSTEIAESDKIVKKSLKSSIEVITKKPVEK